MKNWRGLGPRCTTNSHGAHIIKTQAETLDEAIEILLAKRKRKPCRKSLRVYKKTAEELHLPAPKKSPVTLPTLNWMKSH